MSDTSVSSSSRSSRQHKKIIIKQITGGGRALNAIWRADLSSTQKLVMHCFGSDLNVCGDFLEARFIKQKTIAEKTSLGVSTVRRALCELEKMGYLESEHRIGTTNLYRLTDKLFSDYEDYLNRMSKNKDAPKKNKCQICGQKVAQSERGDKKGVPPERAGGSPQRAGGSPQRATITNSFTNSPTNSLFTQSSNESAPNRITKSSLIGLFMGFFQYCRREEADAVINHCMRRGHSPRIILSALEGLVPDQKQKAPPLRSCEIVETRCQLVAKEFDEQKMLT